MEIFFQHFKFNKLVAHDEYFTCFFANKIWQIDFCQQHIFKNISAFQRIAYISHSKVLLEERVIVYCFNYVNVHAFDQTITTFVIVYTIILYMTAGK